MQKKAQIFALWLFVKDIQNWLAIVWPLGATLELQTSIFWHVWKIPISGMHIFSCPCPLQISISLFFSLVYSTVDYVTWLVQQSKRVGYDLMEEIWSEDHTPFSVLIILEDIKTNFGFLAGPLNTQLIQLLHGHCVNFPR